MDANTKKRPPSRTVHLDEETYGCLVRIAQSEERPYSVVVTRALRLYVEKARDEQDN